MDELEIPGMDSTVGALWEQVQTIGTDFAIKLAIAIVIFYVGRMVARIVARSVRKLMQSQKDRMFELINCYYENSHRGDFDKDLVVRLDLQ